MNKFSIIPFVFLSLNPAELTMDTPVYMEVVPQMEFAVEKKVEIDEAEIKCLADNIYHEARGEDIDGQLAVAYVTLNRVESKRYPNTICEVVWQVTTHYKTKRKTPQFTWTLDGHSDAVKNDEAYTGIVALATTVLNGVVDSNVENALLYHTTAVSPKWSKSKKISTVGTIGDHIFYAYNR